MKIDLTTSFMKPVGMNKWPVHHETSSKKKNWKDHTGNWPRSFMVSIPSVELATSWHVCRVQRDHSDRSKHRRSQQSCSISGRQHLFSYCSGKKKKIYLCNCLLAFCKVSGIVSCSLPFPSLTKSNVAFLHFVLMASKSLHLLSSLSTQSLGQKNHFFSVLTTTFFYPVCFSDFLSHYVVCLH